MITVKGTIKIMGIKYQVLCLTPSDIIKLYFDEQGEEGVASIERVVGRGAQHFGGLCDAGKSRLFVNSEMPLDKQEKVFFHEILEAVDGETIIGLKHNQIEAVANAFFMSGLASTNKSFKGWFANADKESKKKPNKKDSDNNLGIGSVAGVNKQPTDSKPKRKAASVLKQVSSSEKDDAGVIEQ